MRPIRYKMPEVIVSPHAWGRWRERTQEKRKRLKSPKALATVISILLFDALAKGMETDSELSVKLNMGGIVAVVKVDPVHGWVVKTFILPEEEKAG